MSTPASQSPNAMKIGVIYVDYDGNKICSKCGGKSHDGFSAIPHAETAEWERLFDTPLSCDAGCTVYLPVPFSAKLRAARRKADLTQKEASTLCGVSIRCLSMWEKNKNAPSIATQTGALTILGKL